MASKEKTVVKQKQNQKYLEKQDESFVMILHNDDYNTFDHVITCLVDICKHDSIQAEQCAFIVHYNGKSDIKNGDFDTLYLLKQALTDKGLTITIEKK